MKENGTIGYVARETYDYEPEYKLYLIPIVEEETEETPSEEPSDGPTDEPTTPDDGTNELPSVSNDKIKVEAESKQVTIVPGATVQEIIDLVGNDIKLTDKDGNELDKNAILGTGCKINDTYTMTVLGDVSGDGVVDARDSLRILKYSVGSYALNDEFAKAADLNKDGIIDARDSLRILKYSVETFEIKI